MIWLCLHGWGSSAAHFEAQWQGAALEPGDRHIYLDGPERDSMSGRRRWFPFSGQPATLSASLQRCAPLVEQYAIDVLTGAGEAAHAPIGLLGHSQGGMLALALALRQRLNVARVECYCAFLPAAYALPGPVDGGGATPVSLHASLLDQFVPVQSVLETAERLRKRNLGPVVHRIVSNLPHEFLPAWWRENNERSVNHAAYRVRTGAA